MSIFSSHIKNRCYIYIQAHFFKYLTNFIYINLGKKINYFHNKLNKEGILARKGMGVKGYENYLRITLGPSEQMKIFISKLKKLKILN